MTGVRRILPLSLAALVLLAAAPFPATSPIERANDIFPVEPGVNAERGFGVALDREILAVGAPLDDGRAENGGAVYLFRRVDSFLPQVNSSWEPVTKLHGDLPGAAVVAARFGSAVALEDGVLAVAAIGEGAVYVFREVGGEWTRETKLVGPAGQFGRAVALDGGRLAVGSVHPHGRAPGVVHLYSGPQWALDAALSRRRPGERFGEAVALAGDHLVVGAPGHSRAAGSFSGAAYVFQLVEGVWREREKLLATDGREGDQLGAAVGAAVGPDGTTIALGAPTADGEDANSGAVYVSTCAAGACAAPGRIASGAGRGALLGSAVAVQEDLLAAGAPGSAAADDPGTLRIYRRLGGSWTEAVPLPGNAEARDLVGFAVALDGGRAVAAGVLGDQGSAAAGAVWSFVFDADEGWREEAEAVARDLAPLPLNPADFGGFGVSVAAERYLVIGSLRTNAADSPGVVYVYRRAGKGWRQEARLVSPAGNEAPDGFGTAVATHGEALLVGAPAGFEADDVSPPVAFPPRAYLFRRSSGRWSHEESFQSAEPHPGERFGAAVAIEGAILAVGAPRPGSRGVVFTAELLQGEWTQTDDLKVPGGHPGDLFGTALALRQGTLAIGAPALVGGAVHVALREEGGSWTEPVRLAITPLSQADRIGAAVALTVGVLAVGAPGRNTAGAALLLAGSGSSWSLVQEVDPEDELPHEFGSAVALTRDRLAVGAPGPLLADDPGRAYLYVREDVWEKAEEVNALQPQGGDNFGAALALVPDFLVVTSPGPVGGDRATAFKLRPAPPPGASP